MFPKKPITGLADIRRRIRNRLEWGAYWLAVWFTQDTSGGVFSIVRKIIPAPCGLIVDVGANDGISGSQSFPFIKKGWNALLIEPHPTAFQKLQERYSNSKSVVLVNVACSNIRARLPLIEGKGGMVGLSTICQDDNPWLNEVRSERKYDVEVVNLVDLFIKFDIPKEFEILKIDAEYMDYEVLQGSRLDVYQPRIIITEDTATLKDLVKHEFLERHGYVRIARIKVNSIWVKDRNNSSAV